jgi:N-acetylglucosaminyl-diphospho-decaprenol L-rhamnosyltransferase
MAQFSPICSVIIVTHNCKPYLDKAMDCLSLQTVQPQKIILIDSGSQDPSFLLRYQHRSHIEVILDREDIGFCKANNAAMTRIASDSDYVFFLNPDAFLTPDFIEHALAYMEKSENQQVGALTGLILGYDLQKDAPTGKYDSTGIFHKWYGRWYDRGQGDQYQPELYQNQESIPAICGAVYFCRKKALDSVLLRGDEIFDQTFFMYKDDIDLSLRLRKKGWKLSFVPQLVAYHCRGWNRDRTQMPRKLRLYSAWNELRIHSRQCHPFGIPYSLCKYAAVKCLDK